jgi:hypothetical protein
LLLSGYEIAPWGTQTIFSRDVVTGATGSGGQNGRVFEVNHLTTAPRPSTTTTASPWDSRSIRSPI